VNLLAEFRSAVVGVLNDKLPTPLAVWDSIPDDVAEVPCIVVARPSSRQTSTAVVFDLFVDVIVVGRRQEAGGSEAELVDLADDVWTVLGGTRGTKPEGYDLGVVTVDPRTVTIAGLDVPVYVLAVESSAATC
jgi:hypothetical protein